MPYIDDMKSSIRSSELPTLGTSWARVSRLMKDFGINDHDIEAEVLVRHSLGLSRRQFFSSLDHSIEDGSSDTLADFVNRRLKGEPLAYITGHREFYGLEFLVDKHVLIPRQETELLVDMVIAHASTIYRQEGQQLNIADIGTGCGAIAIALTNNLSQTTVYATDISNKALGVADINRKRHQVEDRVLLHEGDLLQALPEQVDIVVSNPPYVKHNDLTTTELRYEPSVSLDGGVSGLETTQRLFEQLPAYVNHRGQIFVEISPEQLAPVTQIAQKCFPHGEVTFARDMLGLPRVISVRVP